MVSDKQTSTFNPAARRKARHYGMQALYQWQMTRNALNEIESQFLTDYDFSNVDKAYFHELVFDIPGCVSELEEAFIDYLQGRSMDELDPIELALLRVGSYELIKRIDIPYKVVINESVSLAKKFGAAESHKYINAVLDKLAQKVRAVEVKAAQR
ncbi:transcription antitermination factor NusB [Dasania sp. GY-MA-18]|uniref:Transcription antitermination protein NusB n=1 Tax=Dasania phycosphaerae TaxID=2950436 RepID=A0A9J6RH14_9GAMM|nr:MULTISPECIES: transcription antitermination factor NusB [Dasania]MCR8921522.1 transcription antitermination factor NusB [Dasania sp. GY-MA-18]MCZ0863950.1 transcription antitermination factor NusB [Dasania phycosphaerae]MCZ0867678.1 transcription antitermination factor NusB [Dasania phycosphaerae]